MLFCGLMASQNWVDIGSGSGLMSDGSKSLPDPMCTNHQHGILALIWGSFRLWYEFENYQFKIEATFPRDQWVNNVLTAINCHLKYEQCISYLFTVHSQYIVVIFHWRTHEDIPYVAHEGLQ